MLFSQRVLHGVAEGVVTVAFRRWRSPQAQAGTRVRTTEGVVDIGQVREVDPAEITEPDAHRAGFASLQGLRSALVQHGNAPVYRVELRYVGPEQDDAVAEPAPLSAREQAGIDSALARYDVSSPRGPWTKPLLKILRDDPGIRAAEIAGAQQRPVSRVKSDVWRLGELGLVEKAPPVVGRAGDPLALRSAAARNAGGFRLSSRGRAYLHGHR